MLRVAATGAAFAAGLPRPPRVQAAENVPSLRAAAWRKGLRYGSDSDCVIADEPQAYATLMQRHCSLLAPLFQWRLTGPSREGLDPGWEDPNIRFARRSGMQLTGGHFLWHESVPDWFMPLATGASEDAIVKHITGMGRAYAGTVFAWNVVNEAIEPAAGPGNLRRSVFVERFGESFFDFSFPAARAADPAALLTYNDYDLEMDTPRHEQRRRAMLALLDRLLARKVPIDAVGLQSHLRLDGHRFDERIYSTFLGEIAQRGVRILVTELDVLDDGRGHATAERDARIADFYRRFLDVALNEAAVASLVTWGLSDRYTWLSPAASPGLGLPPGPPRRPLPFDASFNAKPACRAILAALEAAPARPTAQRTKSG